MAAKRPSPQPYQARRSSRLPVKSEMSISVVSRMIVHTFCATTYSGPLIPIAKKGLWVIVFRILELSIAYLPEHLPYHPRRLCLHLQAVPPTLHRLHLHPRR